MESLWRLLYLLEPAPVTLIVTAVAVTFGSAFRALNYGKEMEKNRDLSEASITLDRSQALMIPVMSSMQFAFDVLPVLFCITSSHCIHCLGLGLIPFLLPISLYCLYKVTVWFGRSICVKVLSKTIYSHARTIVIHMLWYCCGLACFWALDIKQFVGHLYMRCICEPCAPPKHQNLCNAPSLCVKKHTDGNE